MPIKLRTVDAIVAAAKAATSPTERERCLARAGVPGRFVARRSVGKVDRVHAARTPGGSGLREL